MVSINFFLDMRICNKGAKLIANTLKDNKKVKTLIIGGEYTCIGIEGIRYITELLKTNTTIEGLSLKY